jgi:hypothetical protein
MAVSVYVMIPAGPDLYDQVNEKIDIQNNWPEGCIAHMAFEKNGTMHIHDAWESREDFERFAEGRVGPAMQEIAGPDAPSIEPQFNDLHNVATR